MTDADALARYAGYLEGLTPARLAELDQYVAPQVRFADPFHDVTGVAAMRAVFAAMFETIPDVRFEVLASVGGGTASFLHWRFSGHLAGLGGRAILFEGTSVIRFDDHGRVSEHLDYWDSSGGLLQRFPLIGSVLRWLRRRVAATVRLPSGTPG